MQIDVALGIIRPRCRGTSLLLLQLARAMCPAAAAFPGNLQRKCILCFVGGTKGGVVWGHPCNSANL